MEAKSRLSSRGVEKCRASLEESLGEAEEIEDNSPKVNAADPTGGVGEAASDKDSTTTPSADHRRSWQGCEGILTSNPDKPYTEVLVSRTSGLALTKTLGDGELRPAQNQELLRFLQSNRQCKATLSHNELQDFIQSLKNPAAKEEAPSQKPAESAQSGMQVETAEVTVSEVPNNVFALLAANSAEHAVGKGAGKARPPKKRGPVAADEGERPKKARAQPSQSADTSTAPPNDSASVGTGSTRLRVWSKRGTQIERYLAQAQKYTQEIELSDALCGAVNKATRYQCTRIMTCISEHDKTKHTDYCSSSEYIELNAKLAMLDACEELAQLSSLSDERRNVLLAKVSAEVNFPPPFQVLLVVARVQKTQWSSASAIDEWAELVQPPQCKGSEDGDVLKSKEQP